MSKYKKEDKNIERMNRHVGKTLKGKFGSKDIKYKVISAYMDNDGVPVFKVIIIGGLCSEKEYFESKGWNFNE